MKIDANTLQKFDFSQVAVLLVAKSTNLYSISNLSMMLMMN